MYDLLLTNAVVITMDEKRRVIENGAVGVKDGRIAFVGDSMEAEQFEAKEVLDCKDHVVMPGFVDAHGHGGHSAFKSIVDLTSYWMPVMTHTYKNYITDGFWYNEGRLSALERLHAGVTTGVCVLRDQTIAGQMTVDDFFAQYESLKAQGLQEVIDAGTEAYARLSGSTAE